LCCDTPERFQNPGEKCDAATYNGTDTYSCTVDLAQEGYTHCQQECSNWQWAAAVVTATAFYQKQSAPQCFALECAVASQLVGSDCCKLVNGTHCTPACDRTASLADIGTLMEKSNPGHKFRSLNGTLTEDVLMSTLESRQPVFAVITSSLLSSMPHDQLRFGSEAGATLLVVVGYRSFMWSGGAIVNELQISDPAKTGDMEWIVYDDLTSYGGGSWSATLYGLV